MTTHSSAEVIVRPLAEADLPEADRIFRLAFGTFLGLPDPAGFAGDADYIRSRWRSDPEAAFAAEVAGRLVGSSFAANWGSVGVFGPLTIHPDFWDRGVGARLLGPVVETFDRWKTNLAGLYTFAQSPKHLGLYQKFGFWPRFLAALMAREVDPARAAPLCSRYADVPERERDSCLSGCRELTDGIYAGLDLSREIRAADAQGLGETLLLWEGVAVAGLAVCHCGPGSEAGGGACHVKFGAVRPGPEAEHNFDQLLGACEALAAARGLTRLTASVNTGCAGAYRALLARGFRAFTQGVTMSRPDDPGYHRPDLYVIDDWR